MSDISWVIASLQALERVLIEASATSSEFGAIFGDVVVEMRHLIEIGEMEESLALLKFVSNDSLNRYDVLGLDDKPKRNLDCEVFNKNSPADDVKRALDEAKANKQQNRDKALRALLKVIKRGGRLIIPIQAFLNAFEQEFGPLFPEEREIDIDDIVCDCDEKSQA